MRSAVLALVAAMSAAPLAASAEMIENPSQLKRYDVTNRRFDPTGAAGDGQAFVLPVDSPDAEHAIDCCERLGLQ